MEPIKDRRKRKKVCLRYLRPDDYVDVYQLILHSAFESLCDFVEIELEGGNGGHVDWTATEYQRHVKSEILKLYSWWKWRNECRNEEDYTALEKYDDIDSHSSFVPIDAEETRFRLIFTPESEQVFAAERALNFLDLDVHEDNMMLKRLIAIRNSLWT